MRLFLLLLLNGTLAVSCASAQGVQQEYDIYYLSVGSGDYVAVPESEQSRGVNGFGRLPSANKSAVTVARLWQEAGSPYGITLTSDPAHLVTRDNVIDALRSLLSTVRSSGSAHPLIVYYFAGHGVSEGLGWNHFSIPGDFTFQGPLVPLRVSDFGARALYTGDIYDELEQSGIPFIMILDNCQEGKAQRFQEPVLSPETNATFDTVLRAVAILNQFREPDAVLFSTPPGTVVSDVSDPMDPQSSISVAPLARRLMILFQDIGRRQESLALPDLITRLADSSLDGLTRPAITHVELGRRNGMLVSFPAQRGGQHQRLLGTGTGAAPRTAGTRPFGFVPPPRRELRGRSSYVFESLDRDYVGGGRRSSATGPATLVQLGEGTVTLQIPTSDGEGPWDLAFAVPRNQPLRPGSYPNAVRYTFQDADQPGISITKDTRGCGEVQGGFEVDEAAYDAAGSLSRLRIRFRQSCDGKGTLRGSVDFTSVGNSPGR